jgi:membrane protein DedA with SNARE-associated domain
MGIQDQLFQWLTETLTTVYDAIGWTGVVIIMALESANIPIPSEVTMPLAGWLLVQAKGASLVTAILEGGLFGGLGCLIGSVGSYVLGAWGGRPFLEKYGRYILVTPHDLEKADAWFGRWGEWAAFLSRLLPIVRTFISFPAGVVRVNLVRFSILSFVGSFIWCAALAAVGYVVGERVHEIHGFLRPIEIPVAIALIIGFVWYVWHHVKGARRKMDAYEKGEVS